MANETNRPGANIMDTLGYWREYPERDLEHVRRYPCAVQPLTEHHLWRTFPIAFYCHIPFCNNACVNCLYTKHRADDDLVAAYLDALYTEIRLYSQEPYIEDREIVAGYFGGGTPTVLEPEQLRGLFRFMRDHLKTRTDAHISIETTPADIDQEKAELLLEEGVKRISVGIQSFDQELLTRIGRSASAKQNEKVVPLLAKAGFTEINADLMYGLPGETMESWKQTVDKILDQNVESISLYYYVLAPFSRLYSRIQRGISPPCPSDDSMEQMYSYAVERLLSSSFIAVSCMDFMRTDRPLSEATYQLGHNGFHGAVAERFPNLVYPYHTWGRAGELLGLGSGACGYMRRHTYVNDPDINAYVDRVRKGKLPVVMGAFVSQKERLSMSMVYGLKLLRVSRPTFRRLHGIDMMQAFQKEIRQLEEWGLVTLDEEALQVTYPKGWYYIDNICKMFYTEHNHKLPQPLVTDTSFIKYLKANPAQEV